MVIFGVLSNREVLEISRMSDWGVRKSTNLGYIISPEHVWTINIQNIHLWNIPVPAL